MTRIDRPRAGHAGVQGEWLPPNAAAARTGVPSERIAWGLARGLIRYRQWEPGHEGIVVLVNDVRALAVAESPPDR